MTEPLQYSLPPGSPGDVTQTTAAGPPVSFHGFARDDRRRREFRSLVSDIAERLDDKNVKDIAWHKDLPPSLNDKPALDILEHLYRRGHFTEYKVGQLEQLLKDIHREDLIGRVGTFSEEFGRHYSMPVSDSTAAQQQALNARNRRANTLSGSDPRTTKWHTNIPTILTTPETSHEERATFPSPSDESDILSEHSSPSHNIVFPPPESLHQGHWSPDGIMESQPTAGMLQQLYTISNLVPSQSANNSPSFSRLASEGTLPSLSGIHPAVSRRISAPTTRTSLSASNSQHELLIYAGSHSPYSDHRSTSNFSSRNVSLENMQNMLHYQGSMDPNHPAMVRQHGLVLSTSQHSIGEMLPGFGQERQSSQDFVAGPPTPHVPGHYLNGHGPHNSGFMTMPPIVQDMSPSFLPAVPMTRSKSQVYHQSPMNSHANLGHRRNYSSSSASDMRQMLGMFHRSSATFPNDHVHPQVSPQSQPPQPSFNYHRHGGCDCVQCRQAEHTSIVSQMTNGSQLLTQPQMFTGSKQSIITGSAEKVQDAYGEKRHHQSPPSSQLQSAARNNAIPAHCDIGQSESNDGQTDAESCETEHILEQSGDTVSSYRSKEESLEHSLDIKKTAGEYSVSREKDICHSTPTLGSTKKRLPVSDHPLRPNSAVVGEISTTATSFHRNLKSMDTITKSLPVVCPQPEINQADAGPKAQPTWPESAKTKRGIGIFTSKPKPRQLAPNKVEWPIRRDKLNKCIYKLTSKLLTCTTKLELVPLSEQDSGPLPKLMVQLHPYGSEEDGNKFVTAKVTVEFPKKCRLHSKRRIEFKISANEDYIDGRSGSGVLIGRLKSQREKVTQNFFYVKQFINHDDLKNSQCEYIQVTASVELL